LALIVTVTEPVAATVVSRISLRYLKGPVLMSAEVWVVVLAAEAR
jgi:hypothetical protein